MENQFTLCKTSNTVYILTVVLKNVVEDSPGLEY